jgi:hypothetical protein
MRNWIRRHAAEQRAVGLQPIAGIVLSVAAVMSAWGAWRLWNHLN